MYLARRCRLYECVAVRQGRHCSKQFATSLGGHMLVSVGSPGLQKVVAELRVG